MPSPNKMEKGHSNYPFLYDENIIIQESYYQPLLLPFALHVVQYGQT